MSPVYEPESEEKPTIQRLYPSHQILDDSVTRPDKLGFHIRMIFSEPMDTSIQPEIHLALDQQVIV